MSRDVTPRFKQPRAKKPRKAVKARRGTTAASLKKRATEAHSRYVRARDGRCMRCGTVTGQLQCAHIVSRRYSATRTDELNAVCLCATCHRRLTENPHEHVAFFTDYLGADTYRQLIAKAYAGSGKVMRADFWQQELTRLTLALEALS